MFSLRVLLASLVLILLPLDVVVADEVCPTGPFTIDPREIATSFAHPAADSPGGFASSTYSPAEIRRIHNGVVAWYAGAFINDGLQTWTAYDADRHLLIQVRSAGRGSM